MVLYIVLNCIFYCVVYSIVLYVAHCVVHCSVLFLGCAWTPHGSVVSFYVVMSEGIKQLEGNATTVLSQTNSIQVI